MRKLLSGLALGVIVAFCAVPLRSGAERPKSDQTDHVKAAGGDKDPFAPLRKESRPLDKELFKVRLDSIIDADRDTRYDRLTDEDFALVASELDVEVAAVRAVVAIEAGAQMKGFWAPGVPVVNFDRTMYARYRRTVSGSPSKKEKVPSGLSGYALKEWTQLVNARKVNAKAADLGTFWGMFQIGGFNYRKCGCESIEEFVGLMSYSELEQLELFAAFVRNSGMLADLKSKNWSSFARKYNGPSYARRGYHTKMANAYKKFKSQETVKQP